jgi:cytochrome c peroxidase
MKKVSHMSSRASLRLVAIILICTWLPSAAAWGVVGPPGLAQFPLNQIAVPEPPNLFQFVKSKPDAIKLGKAFFWDMQVGSDGQTACATCHFEAGVDKRLKNTVNPGARGGDNTFQVRGPNETLVTTPVTATFQGDFPFKQRENPDFQASPFSRNFNDVVGSQGVKLSKFVSIINGVETVTPLADQVFHVGNVVTTVPNATAPANNDPANNTRRVTARNTPSNINAIFNFHNFWDGRAHFIFNGVNPFGPLDTSASIWVNTGTAQAPVLQQQKIAIEMASLASQATGPPLDDIEMSANGRTFPQLASKLLALTPLGSQSVHPGDSVLGPLSKAVLQPGGKLAGEKGLNTTYSDMIKAAFQDNLTTTALTAPGGPTQMEANFSLFWGLAIQLYEATLISDQTPFDRLLGGDPNALTPQQATGMNIFFGVGKCNLCHAGTELTSASVTAAAFVDNIDNLVVDRMPVANGLDSIYDTGFNATSVGRAADDIGRGGNSPILNPLTNLLTPLGYCSQAELQATQSLPFSTVFLPQNIPANFPVSNDGAFKVPGLRNVELTAPYFHDGSVFTLEDTVDFYTRGGNFPGVAFNPHRDVNIAEIGALQNAPDKAQALVAFMKSLTDERVRNQKAPFDHPELFVPNGDLPNGDTEFFRVPARDANGVAAVLVPITINPVTPLTNNKNLSISGIKESGSTVQVKVNNGVAMNADSPSATAWIATLTGLVDGINNITASGTDLSGVVTTATTTVTLDSTPPALTINPITASINGDDFLLSGTVEAGITPVVSISTAGAQAGAVAVTGGTWSTPTSLLKVGPNNVTVTATDKAGNVTSATATIFVLPDGIFSGTKIPDISDAIKALRIAVGIVTPTADDLLHGDVAPLGMPDGKIDLSDVVLIMRNVVGTITLSN